MNDIEKCKHVWKYVESGYNRAGFYCDFYECEKCGETKAEWCD